MIRPPKPKALFHLALDINAPFPKDVLISGDPNRVDKMLAKFSTGKIITDPKKDRGLRVAVGTIEFDQPKPNDQPLNIAAISCGMGGPTTGIALEELIHLGIERVIRVGTCGLLDRRLKLHDLIFSQAAYRGDATGDDYTGCLGKAFPAACNYELLKNAERAARQLNYRFAIGVTAQIAGFYPFNFPTYALDDTNAKKKQALIDMDCLALCMEEDTIYLVAQQRRIQALSILAATDIAYEDQEEHIEGPGIDHGIDVAISTLFNMHIDRLKKNQG